MRDQGNCTGHETYVDHIARQVLDDEAMRLLDALDFLRQRQLDRMERELRRG